MSASPERLLPTLSAPLLCLANRVGVRLGGRVAARSPGRDPAAPAAVLLRVDDYPHWSVGLDQFWAFHETLQEAGVSYLLAATPFLARDPFDPASPPRRMVPEEWARLAAAVTAGALEVALHGSTHRTRTRGRHSEYDGLSAAVAQRELAAAWERLVREGCEPVAFVPPFNRFPPALWHALPDACGVLCLGPESLRDSPLVAAAAVQGGRSIVWSLPPFYSRAATIADALERGAWLSRPGALIPVTLHWTWELDDQFAGVARLARMLAGHTIRWRAIAPERLTSMAHEERR